MRQGGVACQDQTALTSTSVQTAISAIPSLQMQRMVQEMQMLEDVTLKVQRTHL